MANFSSLFLKMLAENLPFFELHFFIFFAFLFLILFNLKGSAIESPPAYESPPTLLSLLMNLMGRYNYFRLTTFYLHFSHIFEAMTFSLTGIKPCRQC